MVIKSKKWSFLAYALLFLTIGLISLWPQKAAATTGVPQLISFEGKIVHSDGTNITDGTYNMEFDIYTGCTNEPASNTGCTVAWTEDWLVHNTQGVAFTSGTYAVNLGSITSLSSLNFNSYPLYISVDIGNTTNVASTCAGSANFNTNCGGDGVMNPYIELTSAPYAINSGELGGLTASQFGQLAANNTWTGTNKIQPSVSTTAFSVMNASNADFTVDTSGNNVIVGKAGAQTAVLELANATGTNVVGLQAGASTAAYTLTLPTTTPSTNQCLAAGPSTATSLVFTSCTAGTYLAKNSADTSSAAVTTGNFLYAFTNSSSAVTSGVLSLNNGSNTNDTLYVTTSGNPAAGQALIAANETNASPSGNLLDLQVSAASKFKVDVGGNVTAVGTTGLTLSGNGAGISFTGTGPNVIKSQTAATGGQLTLSGGTSTTSGNVGGTLLLQGGAGGGAAASGSVIVKSNTNNSTTAFQIQNTSGSSGVLLNADTTNMRISVGTLGTSTSQLYVSGNIPSATAAGTLATATNPEAVFIQGNYAYVAGYGDSTVRIIDISNPLSPTAIKTISVGNDPEGLTVQGHYLYVVDYIGNHLLIYDVSNPYSPTLMSTTSTGASSYPQYLYVQGRYAYVVVANGLAIYDVSNPSNPMLVNTVSLGGGPIQVWVQGRYAYVTAYSSGYLDVVDVSNPATASEVGAVSLGVSTNPDSLKVQGHYAYVDEVNTNKVAVVDVTNPASPTLLTSVTIGGTSAAGLSIQGRYLWGVSTTAIAGFDISNPASPVSLGSVTTTGCSPQDVSVIGRYAYVPCWTSNSLNVYDLGGTYDQQLQAGGIETGTLQVDNNALFAGDANVEGGLTVGQSLQINGNVATSGQVLFQNTTNSTTAFQVQNSSGATILATDTTNNELNVSGVVNLVSVAPPSSAPTAVDAGAGSLAAGTYYYGYTYTTPLGETHVSSASSGVTIAASHNITVTVANSPSNLVSGKKIYRSTSLSGPYQYVGTISGNTTTTFTDSNTSPTVQPKNLDTTAALFVNGSINYASDTVGGNLLLGPSALSSLQQGYGDTAIGNAALTSVTNDTEDTAVGSQALQNNNNSAGSNTGVGFYALQATSTGYNDTAVGDRALANNTLGYDNTGLGTNALGTSSTGNNNTGVGYHALYSNSSGSNNTAIGYRAGEYDSGGNFYTGSALQNAAAIGSYAQVQASNTIVLGSVDTPTITVVGATEGSVDGSGTQTGNPLQVDPLAYNTGTACSTATSAGTTCAAGAYLYGTGTTWTAAMVGDQIIFADGTTANITAYTSATALSLDRSISETSTTYYRIHQIGLQVTGSGYVGIGTSAPSQVLTVNGNGLIGSAANKAFIGDVGWSGAGYSSGFASTATNATQTAYALLQKDDGTITALNAASGGTVSLRVANSQVVNVTSSLVAVSSSAGGGIAMTVTGRIQTGDGSNAGGVWVNGTGTSGNTMFMGDDGGSYIGFYNSGWGLLMDSSQDVAVNGATPTASYPLNVSGGEQTTGNIFVNSASAEVQFGATNDFWGQYGGSLALVYNGLTEIQTNSDNLYLGNGAHSLYDNVNTATAGAAATALCKINATGQIATSSSAACANPSSIAYKQNVVPLVNQAGVDPLSVINQLTPVSFDWKASSGYNAQNGGSHDFGFIAQSVDPILPELVQRDNNGVIVGLNYLGFIPFAIGGVQEVQQEVVGTQNTLSAMAQSLQSGSLNITGDATIQGALSTASLNVAGNATINDLTVTDAATVKSLTVTGDASVLGNLTVNGHIITGGNTPTVQLQAAAGSSNASVSISGNDTAGTITITTGDPSSPARNGQPAVTGPVSGDQVALTFSNSYGSTPRIILTGNDSKSAGLQVYPDQESSTGFTLGYNQTPKSNTTYTFNYFIIQ